MSYTDKHIINSYSNLFEGLSSDNKLGLIESLSKSLKKEKASKESQFYKSFGSFSDEKSAEEIIKEIKANRVFKKKELKF